MIPLVYCQYADFTGIPSTVDFGFYPRDMEEPGPAMHCAASGACRGRWQSAVRLFLGRFAHGCMFDFKGHISERKVAIFLQ